MTFSQLVEMSLLLFITTLVITIGIQYLHNISLKNEIEDYVQQIDRLHSQAIKAKIEAEQAAIIAARSVTASNMKSSQIMKENISHNCEKAISWAISEAHKI